MPTSKSPWLAVFTTPALLVPAALAGVVVTIAETGTVHGYPWSTIQPWYEGGDAISGIAILFAMSVCVAGYIGLLKPLHAGVQPDGTHFWGGIKDHTLTMFLGQAAVLSMSWLLSSFLVIDGAHATSFTTIFLLAPSLIFAPLLGTTALHPRRPIRAFRACLDRVTWDLHETSRLLCGQILLMVPIWLAFIGDARGGMKLLFLPARECSALSFNPFPTPAMSVYGLHPPAVNVLLIAASMVTSTVFMMLYHRRVVNRPTRPPRRT